MQRALIATIGLVLLAGCAMDNERVAEREPAPRVRAEAPPKVVRDETSRVGVRDETPRVRVRDELPNVTGIPVCDDYLTSYRSCHVVLGVYDADNIQTRYQNMHESLVSQAVDPAQRKGLEQRCIALTQQMDTDLDGRECDNADPLVIEMPEASVEEQ